MEKRAEYNTFEWQIIAGSVMLVLVAVLFLSDSGITGMATRSGPKDITLIENNETPILVPVVEKPGQVQGTIEEPQIETQAGCVVPYENMNINTDTTFCGGTYYLNHTNKNNIKIRGDDIVVDCNGSTIEGDYATQFTTGISLVGENITLKNCNIRGYSTCISITNYGVTPAKLMESAKIIYNNLTRCDGLAGIFIDGQTEFNISNNRFVDFNDYYERAIGSHAVYISSYNQFQSPQGGHVYNNYIYDMSASGVKINGYGTIRNIQIYNNVISALTETQGDDYGVHIADAENISVFNNQLIGPYDAGIVLNVGTNVSHYANNNLIYGNTFTNLNYGVWSKSNTYNNYAFNNDFSGINLEFRINANTNISISELDSVRVGYSYGQYILYANFTGIKNFTINSYNLTIYNNDGVWDPYNDVKNVSNGVVIASNVDTYSVMLSNNYKLIVGNFVADPEPANNVPSISVSLSQDLNCSTITSDSDGDSLTTTIQWYYNGTLDRTVTASSDVQTNLTGTHYCRARAYDGMNYSNWVTSNTVIINAILNETSNETNETIYIAPVISGISLSDDLNCSASINKLSNITIDYYLDDTINNTVTLEANGSFSASTQRFNGTWYCDITATDGINITSGISNIVIINETVNETSNETIVNIMPIVTVSLSAGLMCSGTVNEPVNMTILFYKDNAVADTAVYQGINGTFSATTSEEAGTWYCQVSATDGINTTIVQSNSVEIDEERQSSGGGGGGGSSSGGGAVIVDEDPKKNNETVTQNTTIIDKTPQKAVDEPTAEDTTPIIEEVSPPIIEEPKKVSVLEKYWRVYLISAILFLGISLIFIRIKTPITHDNKLDDYIIKSLQTGYSYAAIRRALSKHYKQSEIDQHFHILMRNNLKPIKTKKIERHVPKERQKQAILSIKTYIVQQKNMGYKEKDIIGVLLQNGYPKALIKEAIRNA